MEIAYAVVALAETEYIFSVHSEEIFPMGTFFHVREFVLWIYEVVAYVCMLGTRRTPVQEHKFCYTCFYKIFSRKLRHSLSATILLDCTEKLFNLGKKINFVSAFMYQKSVILSTRQQVL